MKPKTLYLAWRYLLFHKMKTTILFACLGLTFLLPLGVHFLVGYYETTLAARALDTPLVIGAPGNRFDLVLKSLYFATDYADAVDMSDVEVVTKRNYGTAVPIHVRYYAHKLHTETEGEGVVGTERAPIVGTDLAYFELRKLEVAQGTFPLVLGDAVVGSKAARRLGVSVGEAILSNPTGFYNLAHSFQLRMPVVGVLAQSGSPDDHAVFVDIKTAWVLDGIGHGHDKVETPEDASLVNDALSSDKNVVAASGLAQYQKITSENRDSFHFHGAPEDFPATAVLLFPEGERGHTLAVGRFNARDDRQILAPSSVIKELMSIVFRIKDFFDANFLLVTLTTALFVTLVIVLSLRIRKKEMETLYRIGCARGTVFRLQAWEIVIVTGAGLALATILAYASLWLVPYFTGFLSV